MKQEEITLQKLKEIFVGKNVKITHTVNSVPKDRVGVCKNIHQTNLCLDFELNNNSRYCLVPDTLTATYVEGEIGMIYGRRKIEII